MSSGRKKLEKYKRQNRIMALIICALVLLIALCAWYIFRENAEKKETESRNKAYSELYRAAQNTPTSGEAVPASASEAEAEAIVVTYPRPPEKVQKGFDELLAINPDTVGWLRIPQTTVEDIDLPVVQRDNSFYLNHNFEGEADDAGCVFLDHANSVWPSDEHMILYGHNMKNGTMLARVTRYKSLDYARNNPILYFDTLYERGSYVVLAAMQLPSSEMMNDEFSIRTFTFGEVSFDAFLYEVRKRAMYVTGVGANEFDQLLSVITCSYNEDDERFVLMARRLRENETEQDIYRMAGK